MLEKQAVMGQYHTEQIIADVHSMQSACRPMQAQKRAVHFAAVSLHNSAPFFHFQSMQRNKQACKVLTVMHASAEKEEEEKKTQQKRPVCLYAQREGRSV